MAVTTVLGVVFKLPVYDLFAARSASESGAGVGSLGNNHRELPVLDASTGAQPKLFFIRQPKFGRHGSLNW